MSQAYDDLKAREEAAIMHTYGRYPLALASGQGCKLYDLDGREYLDLLAGIAVVNLGHCHPELAQVMAEQAKRLVHVSNLFYQTEQVELAELLLSTCAAERVFFCNSGAEANEGAIKLARRYMRKLKGREAYEIVTLKQSFHGRTLATLTATGQDKVKEGFAPLPEGFVCVEPDDLAAMERAIGERTAGVLIEVVQGEGGVRPLAPEYLQGLQKLCAERGALFIIDEIQTGLCRTGRFWAHQHFGLTPDIFTSAKGLANGLPMGAVLASAEVAKGFEPGSHATTFGGGPLVSKVAAKTVEIMLRDGLAERAAELGAYARCLFLDLQKAKPGKIAGVRGLGLMIGVELTFAGQDIWKELLNRGFILNLTQDRVLRLLPPLTVSRAELERFSQALAEVLDKA